MKFSSFVVAILSVGRAASSGAVVEITKGNFAESISGKNAFVKFLAPW